MWKSENFSDICLAIDRQVELQVRGYEVKRKRTVFNEWIVSYFDDEVANVA